MGSQYSIFPSRRQGVSGNSRPDELAPDEVEILIGLIESKTNEYDRHRRLHDFQRLCDRHAWGCLVVELELIVYGVGGVSAHLPLQSCVANAAELEVLTGQLVFASHHRISVHLRPKRVCPVCVELRRGALMDDPRHLSDDRARVVSALTFTRWWLDQSERLWHPLVCPECATGRTGWAGTGPLCRAHLRQALRRPGFGSPTIVVHLDDLRKSMMLLTSSFLHFDSVIDPESGVSACFAAIGWLHGWDLPLALSTSQFRR